MLYAAAREQEQLSHKRNQIITHMVGAFWLAFSVFGKFALSLHINGMTVWTSKKMRFSISIALVVFFCSPKYSSALNFTRNKQTKICWIYTGEPKEWVSEWEEKVVQCNSEEDWNLLNWRNSISLKSFICHLATIQTCLQINFQFLPRIIFLFYSICCSIC